MIDTKTEELAALYVLDLLEGEELAGFEQRLVNEPDVTELVRGLSTGLHTPMKGVNGPERLDLLDGIRDQIGLAPEQSKTEIAPPTQKVVPFRWIPALSAAAAILLVLNLFQFFGNGTIPTDFADELTKSRLAKEALLAENKTIKAFNESWETEYMNLAQRMLPFVESRDGLGQFTVIDLVNVKGSSNSNNRGEGDIAEYFLSRSPLKFASVKMSDIPEMDESITIGYTVWKKDEKRGYIDLYNLPEAGPNRAPFLWVRSVPTESYIPVGYLPALDMGTGTFYFTINQKAFNPTEVLITEETVTGPGKQPSRHRLMVGP